MKYTRVIVAPPDENSKKGIIITAFPADTVGDNVGGKLYDKNNL
jgi:hypothetical protein